jgi:translation initiation factor 2 beta subunit (eIF-2beta)/eIF-5
MSDTPNNRLDCTEAALDRQVDVNADLRASVQILQNRNESLQASVADLRFKVEALMSIALTQQKNFGIIAEELKQQKMEIAQLCKSQLNTDKAIDRIGIILEKMVIFQSQIQERKITAEATQSAEEEKVIR